MMTTDTLRDLIRAELRAILLEPVDRFELFGDDRRDPGLDVPSLADLGLSEPVPLSDPATVDPSVAGQAALDLVLAEHSEHDEVEALAVAREMGFGPDSPRWQWIDATVAVRLRVDAGLALTQADLVAGKADLVEALEDLVADRLWSVIDGPEDVAVDLALTLREEA